MSDPTDLPRYIQGIEEQLLTPAVRFNADLLVTLLAEDFREFDSSGRVFNRSEIIEYLASESTQSKIFDQRSTEDQAGSRLSSTVISTLTLADFVLQPLAPDLALTTYRAIRCVQTTGEIAASLRSSLWRRCTSPEYPGGQWQMFFHQGTPIPVAALR